MKLFKCAFLIVVILFCGCGESGGEFDAINVGKISVVYENQTLKIAESSALNSSLGASFALGGNFGEQQTHKSSFIPKISSKYKTSTANTRIWDLDSAKQTQIAETALDSAFPKHEANSSIADEFLGLCEASDEDRTNGSSRKRADALPKKSLRDAEFADSAPQDFILFFFTSTCGVCKAQLPILEQLSTQGIKIYAILGDVPDISKASAFVRAHKISLPLFYESGARRFFTSAVGGVKGVPVMVIFKDGKMKEKFIGLTPKGTLLRVI